MAGGAAAGEERIFQSEVLQIATQAGFQDGEVAPTVPLLVGDERNQIGGVAVRLGELTAQILELAGDAESEGKRPFDRRSRQQGGHADALGDQTSGEQRQDEGIGCGLRRRRKDVFGGRQGTGKNGGPMVGSEAGQGGAKPASGVAGRNDDEAFTEVQRTPGAPLEPIAGQDVHRGREGGCRPSMEMPGDGHG